MLTALRSRLRRAAVVPIFPVILTSPVPATISKFLAPSTFPSRVTAPFPSVVSIRIVPVASSVSPVMVRVLLAPPV